MYRGNDPLSLGISAFQASLYRLLVHLVSLVLVNGSLVFVNLVFLMLIQLGQGMFIVTFSIHGQPVIAIPEQFVVAFVWYDVVNDICRFENMT